MVALPYIHAWLCVADTVCTFIGYIDDFPMKDLKLPAVG